MVSDEQNDEQAEPIAIQVVRIEDLLQDEHNANLGTERGTQVLDDSLRNLGAGRSVLVDKHNRLIAGNKTHERAADIGIKRVVLVDSDGTTLVAVRRTDLDLEDDTGNRARSMAYYDNRGGQLNLNWDMGQIGVDLERGVDLAGLWGPTELALFTGPPSLDSLADQFGDPDPKDFWPVLRIRVSPETYDLWVSLFEQCGTDDEGEALGKLLGAVDVGSL